MTRFPLWLSWAILFILAVGTWKLDLPEGWPRFVAVIVWVVALVLLLVVSVRKKSLNDKAAK